MGAMGGGRGDFLVSGVAVVVIVDIIGEWGE